MEGSEVRPIDSLPAGLIRLRDGRIVPRRNGWISAGDLIRCPFNHHVTLLSLHEGAGTVVCKHRPDPSQGHCGCPLYIATGAMGFYLVDLTIDEKGEIERLGIRPNAVARFLGITFPSPGPIKTLGAA